MADLPIQWTVANNNANSTGQQVQYKLSSDSTWLNSGGVIGKNVTTATITGLLENTSYDVRVLNICSAGGPTPSVVFVWTVCTCATGYERSADASRCEFIDEVPVIDPTGAAVNTIAAQNVVYSSCGSYIYDSGYNLNGTGTSTQIPLSNPFWVNGNGDCGIHSNSAGPLNRSGVWIDTSGLTSDESNSLQIGFSACVEVPTSKVYYVGLAADNYCTLKIDGVTIIDQSANALSTQYGGNIAATFKIWHIYPVILAQGSRIVEMIGVNTGSVAAMGAEIYNATPSELIAATSYQDLGAKLIFSTKDQINQPIQIGTSGTGYTCPAGYSLVSCVTPYVCRKVIVKQCGEA